MPPAIAGTAAPPGALDANGAGPGVPAAQGPGALPKTGTGAALFLLIGLLLLGLAFVVRARRWTFA